MSEGSETRLTYGQLQVIAVPSRLKVLRALTQRRLTVTELADAAGLAKSTTHGHLLDLERVGLVKRLEDERLWVYHELTPLGRSIVSSNPWRLVVLFSAGILFALTGLLVVVWRWQHPPHAELPWGLPPIGAPPEAPLVDPILAAGTVLALVGIALAGCGWWASRRLGSSTLRA